MTEEEIEAAAVADLDNPPLTDEDLKKFRRVPNLKKIRQKLHMTQEQFAMKFHIPLGTLRDWKGLNIPILQRDRISVLLRKLHILLCRLWTDKNQ